MPIWRGVTNDWGTASNWIIDGLGNSGVPTSTTDAIFDALSITPCTTGAGNRICRDLITTGFTNVLTVGTSATLGYIQVYRNITLGSQPGHIAGLSYIGIFGATCTLDVATGFTVPYLSFGTAAGGGLCTVTLFRSFVVTTLLKTGSGLTATITAASAMSIDITNGTLSSNAGHIILNTNVILKFVGTCTIGSFNFNGGEIRLDTGATLTPRTTGVNSVAIAITGTCKLDFSQGTFINAPINLSFNLGFYIFLNSGTFTFNFGTNSIDSLVNLGGTIGGVAIILQSNLVINRNYYVGFATLVTGAFNIIVKDCLAQGAIRSHPSGKLIYQGSSTGFIALGYISGTTLTITTPIQGQLTFFQYIHVPSVGGSYIVNGCTTFNSIYTLTTSQTVGSAGSPVMIYGNSITNITLNDNVVGANVTFEIDAGSNDVYLIGDIRINNNSSFTYLSTNTGAFYGERATIRYYQGSIDFQGQSSASKKIGTLINLSFYSGVTLKSDLWVTTLTCLEGSGILQTGSRTIYVLGNFSANNGIGIISANNNGVIVQPTIVLYGSDPCTFTCINLNANVTIDKVGGTVTNTSSFNYVTTATGGPYTFRLNNGTFVHGAFTTTVGAAAIFNTPGLNWNNITVNNNVTITINALLNITGTLAITSGTTTFAGTFGWNCGTITCSTASTIIVLQSGITYTTTVNAAMLGTNAGRITMRSNAPTVSYAIWTLQNPATQSMVYVNAQGIDSNAGMTIYSFQGVILTSLPALNWFNGASQGTKAFTFVS